MRIDRNRSLLAAFGVALTVSIAAPAAAQSSDCASRNDILTKLEQAFEERPVSVGVTSRGELLEIVAGPSGSWTLLVTLPGGPTCMLSHGDGWEFRGTKKKDPLA